MKTLYRHGTLLCSGEDGFTVVKDGFLGVENDRICYLGATAPAEEYDVKKDMTGKILMPGLYNCHTHSPMVLLRGVGSDLPLDQWLFGKICPIEDRMTPEDVKAGSALAVMEMIAGGTVSFSDMYFSQDQTAQVVAETGMKANLSRHVQSFVPGERPEDCVSLQEAKSLYAQYNGSADGRVKVDWCVHAEYTCTEAMVRAVAECCKATGGNLHIHLSETEKEHLACKEKYGVTPAAWFEKLGAFDCGGFAAHCVALEDDDIEILKRHGVSVAHNPTSNMKLGSGVAPVEKFVSRGLNVTIGTDGAASNTNLNMFEERHLASVLQNGFLRDATVMNAGTVLKMATENGAKLQRRDNCGKLAVGYQADFIAIDTDKPHLTPCLDMPALIVYAAQASDVALTVVDGKILYENGDFKTVDKEKTYYEVKKAVERLYR